MDPERKRELKKAFKAKELEEARRNMCLFPDQLRELLGCLENSMEELGIPCDHTLSRTIEWSRREQLDPEKVVASVQTFGGYCDCEVLLNVRPYLFGWPE